jgi:DNA-binding CsgD family transcriptional regulator
MTDPDQLEQLVDLAYSAAIDDALWPLWTQSVIDKLGADGGLFWVIDAEREEMSRSFFHFPGGKQDVLISEYQAEMVRLDPQMDRVCTSDTSEIYLDTDHVSIADRATREYLNWQVDRCGTRHHMTASVVLSDTLRAGISVHRSPEAGPANNLQQRALRAIFPQMARALNLGFKHHAQMKEAWWAGVTEPAGKAFLLIDEHGRVHRLSAAAKQVIERGDGLSVMRDRLVSRNAGATDALARIVLQAVSRQTPQSGSATVPRTVAKQPYRVVAYPLPVARRFLVPNEAAALVEIIDPIPGPASPGEVYRTVYGLTKREAEISALLASGLSLETAAERLGISRNTVRVHLQSLFAKTGTNRQAELMKVLLAVR